MDNSGEIILSDQSGQTFNVNTHHQLAEVKVPQIPTQAKYFNNWIMETANATRNTYQKPDQSAYNWVTRCAKAGTTYEELGKVPPEFASLEMKLNVGIKKVLPQSNPVRVDIDHMDRQALKFEAHK